MKGWRDEGEREIWGKGGTFSSSPCLETPEPGMRYVA